MTNTNWRSTILITVYLLFMAPAITMAQPEASIPSTSTSDDPALHNIDPASQKDSQEARLAGTQLFLPTLGKAGIGSASPGLTGHFEERVVELSNAQRAEAGCKSLTMNDRLHEAAKRHTRDMALNDFFSHTGSDGSTPWDRIRDAGYHYSKAGENIAAGYTSPEAVVGGWMKNPGHRAIILDCDLQEIGVSYHYLAEDSGKVNHHHYWTQVFGRP